MIYLQNTGKQRNRHDLLSHARTGALFWIWYQWKLKHPLIGKTRLATLCQTE